MWDPVVPAPTRLQYDSFFKLSSFSKWNFRLSFMSCLNSHIQESYDGEGPDLDLGKMDVASNEILGNTVSLPILHFFVCPLPL